ncbi:MAG TPA: GAF domain-containing protein [Stellaceae bacterium]|nr:GAF domain-containing protein [Stellaceae bacterium]
MELTHYMGHARRVLESVIGRPIEGAQDLAEMARDSDPELSKRLFESLRRLAVLTEVSDTVTEQLSLDHQLPRMIALIAEVFDAERATLFLHDPDSGELFSRVAVGDGVREIRIPASAGIAGAVFQSGKPEIIADAYKDTRFNQAVDRETGYVTRDILCVPLRNREGAVTGVTQALNRRKGEFTPMDLALLEAINRQASNAIEEARLVELVERARREEAELLSITEAISTELQLDVLLGRIMQATTSFLGVERATLFIHDPATNELWSKVTEGGAQKEIRVPALAGLVGAAFGSGEVLEIPDAYADPRFNATVDKATGFRTRNLLCVPLIDRAGSHLGVVQVLNKRGGPFSPVDVRRLKAFSAQIAIAIHNAQLFSDVLALKNYNESILKSLSNGVVTLDQKLNVAKANEAAERILGTSVNEMVDRPAEQVFGNRNGWVTRSLEYVVRMNTTDYHADTELLLPDGTTRAVNLTTAPLLDLDNKAIGYMVVLDDITREKRVRSTMSRYMAKEVVDRLLASGDEMLKGSSHIATVLFSDIRQFTMLTEAMSPQQTVAMLNEYFSEMVEVVLKHGGMLDKYIGDALMAIFGAPVEDVGDVDRAMTVASDMVRALEQLNARRIGAGMTPIDIGIGLATGEVLAGSVGSVKRMEYTVIGDTVNLAARLESANKHYGTRILISGATAEGMSAPAIMRRIDVLQVKGKSRPTDVYELMSYHTPHSFPNLARVIALYEKGFKLYQTRDWAGATAQFMEALDLAPNDKPSRVFLDRCRYYLRHPPSEDWNGVWIMEEK